MTEPITINALLQLGGIIAAVWGGYKILMEIINAITARHDKEQSWSKQHKEMSDKYDKAIADLNAKIDENQIDVEAKIQEVRAEQEILTECMYATLDGLHQLGCNGKVTEARSMLDQYLIKRAHD